ncbi:MAG: hypothetical protein JST55_09405, partial [Bacteroidetes bacterium]|nr:hypothetical protein [Bacteroidota bacterium]
MKKKIFFLLFFFLISFLNTEAQFDRNKFYLGLQGGNYNSSFYSNYNLLYINSTVDFGFEGDFYSPSPTRIYGGFFDPLSSYSSYLNGAINDFYNTIDISNPHRPISYYRSAKIIRPAFGQRSTYEAEQMPDTNFCPGYFFSFHQIGDSFNSGGIKGRFCSVSLHSHLLSSTKKYMVSSLYENNEQTDNRNLEDYGRANYSDIKFYGQGTDTNPQYKWFIKPRMRIDTSIAHNLLWEDSTVVTIEIYSFDSSLVKEVPIKVRSFKSDSLGFLFKSTYGGEFIEMYKLTNDTLTVTGKRLAQGANDNKWNSRVDYRVRWNGKVDVWLDYVRVDDEWAHYLFTGSEISDSLDTNNRWKFHKRLKEEINSLSSANGLAPFYFDEFYYNNVDCIAKVDSIIREINPNSGLIIMANIWSGVGYYKHFFPYPDNYFNFLKSKGLLKDGFMTDNYPIYWDTEFRYPSNLSLKPLDGSISTHYHIAADGDSYNVSLNYHLNGGYYNDMKAASDIIKNSNSNSFWVSAIQTHCVETNVDVSGNVLGEARREPTNEEIKVQAYLSLAYGAKQIQYFNYESWGIASNRHDWGLSDTPATNRRTSNYYYQDKFDSVAKYSEKILKIGRYMYDSLNLKFAETRSFKNNGLGGTYIDSIRSIKNSTEDDAGKKYWHFGFFTPNNTIEPNSYSKYFLAVNMACMPDTLGQGDIKELKLKFNSSDLTTFNNWKLLDPISHQEFGTFNKSTNAYISAGMFLPGEGKLLKLVPVMQDGGTFVTNEFLSNISFNCNGTVNANSHNLVLNEGVNISFADSVQIIMPGGKFASGVSGRTRYSNLTAQSGKRWLGLKFDGTSVNMNLTRISGVRKKNSDNHEYTLYIINPDTLNITYSRITPIASEDSSASGVL